MKTFVKSVLGGAALLGISMTGSAQAEPDYPYAATAFIGGGGHWTDFDGSGNVIVFGDGERDVATIVGGGDIVLPLNGYWNVQLGGALRTDHEHFIFFGPDSVTQFQGGAIAFWRNPELGVFGIEGGLFSPFEGGVKYAKVGGVAEYFFDDMATIGGFGGVLIPFGQDVSGVNTGFYAGGHATWYASQNLALAGFARYLELGFDNFPGDATEELLTAGGKVRYLTSMPGVEVYASGAYYKCAFDVGFASGEDTGVEVMAGVKIRLGGHTNSLVAIDRSNAVDTRAWDCDG